MKYGFYLWSYSPPEHWVQNIAQPNRSTCIHRHRSEFKFNSITRCSFCRHAKEQNSAETISSVSAQPPVECEEKRRFVFPLWWTFVSLLHIWKSPNPSGWPPQACTDSPSSVPQQDQYHRKQRQRPRGAHRRREKGPGPCWTIRTHVQQPPCLRPRLGEPPLVQIQVASWLSSYITVIRAQSVLKLTLMEMNGDISVTWNLLGPRACVHIMLILM